MKVELPEKIGEKGDLLLFVGHTDGDKMKCPEGWTKIEIPRRKRLWWRLKSRMRKKSDDQK